MDPLEVIGNLHKIKPVYQPIVSAIKHDVMGFEVLGRFQQKDQWVSLGPFFHDPEVPEEFKVDVDQYLLENALSEMMESNQQGYLFINRSANQLMLNSGEDLLKILQSYEKKGFSMKRIVIEVTEHDFEEDFKDLIHLLLYYKTYGIQIAVDHVGAKSSNLDRLRQLSPHILKIDTKRINSDGFQDVMYSLSMLARKIGAALLFENIEDDYHFQFAWKHGGRYYQGYLLDKPDFKPNTDRILTTTIKERVASYVKREKSLIEQRLIFGLTWENKIKEGLSKWDGPKKVDSFVESILPSFDKESFRMYVSNSDGIQISSNYRKKDGSWVAEPEKKDSNWSFRPYFLENMVHMKTLGKGILSEIYSDIETREMIRSFSFPVTEQYYLFIDIQYSFIFEHECLLI